MQITAAAVALNTMIARVGCKLEASRVPQACCKLLLLLRVHTKFSRIEASILFLYVQRPLACVISQGLPGRAWSEMTSGEFGYGVTPLYRHSLFQFIVNTKRKHCDTGVLQFSAVISIFRAAGTSAPAGRGSEK